MRRNVITTKDGTPNASLDPKTLDNDTHPSIAKSSTT
jgi:hypothetical protein